MPSKPLTVMVPELANGIYCNCECPLFVMIPGHDRFCSARLQNKRSRHLRPGKGCLQRRQERREKEEKRD